LFNYKKRSPIDLTFELSPWFHNIIYLHQTTFSKVIPPNDSSTKYLNQF